MRVLITGGSGFLGTAIIQRLLDSDIQVRAISRTGKEKQSGQLSGNKTALIEWRTGDIAVAEDVLSVAADCDAIIHLAGVLTPFCKNDPVAGATVNVIGTLNVFEAAKRQGINKVIYSSSGGVFGPDDSSFPLPTTHYGAFKLANEAAARTYWADDQIASIGFRPFVVYGPGRERGLSAGPTLACRAAARIEPYTIPLTGTIGLVYIDDVAASFAAALQTSFDGAHVFNLPGVPVAISEIIEKIRRIVPGAQLDCAGEPLPMVSTTRNDYSNDLLEVPPAVSVDAGLRRTIDHYRNAM
jgi:UDP-glucose 4-epimerase